MNAGARRERRGRSLRASRKERGDETTQRDEAPAPELPKGRPAGPAAAGGRRATGGRRRDGERRRPSPRGVSPNEGTSLPTRPTTRRSRHRAGSLGGAARPPRAGAAPGPPGPAPGAPPNRRRGAAPGRRRSRRDRRLGGPDEALLEASAAVVSPRRWPPPPPTRRSRPLAGVAADVAGAVAAPPLPRRPTWAPPAKRRPTRCRSDQATKRAPARSFDAVVAAQKGEAQIQLLRRRASSCGEPLLRARDHPRGCVRDDGRARKGVTVAADNVTVVCGRTTSL